MKYLSLFISKFGMYILALIALYIIVQVKFKCFCEIPCFESQDTADDVNEVLVNLSYSTLAAVIFQIVVVQVPFWLRRRCHLVTIRHEILQLQIMLCESRDSIADCFKKLPKDRNEYIDFFEQADLEQTYLLGITKHKRILDFLIYNQIKIREQISNILEFKEYLNFSELEILTQMSKSPYLRGPLIIRPHLASDNTGVIIDIEKKREIGESIFDLTKTACKLKSML